MARRALREKTEPLAKLDLLALQERRVQRAPLETLVLLDLRVPKESLGGTARSVPQDRKVNKVLLVKMELWVLQVQRVQTALMEQKAL